MRSAICFYIGALLTFTPLALASSTQQGQIPQNFLCAYLFSPKIADLGKALLENPEGNIPQLLNFFEENLEASSLEFKKFIALSRAHQIAVLHDPELQEQRFLPLQTLLELRLRSENKTINDALDDNIERMLNSLPEIQKILVLSIKTTGSSPDAIKLVYSAIRVGIKKEKEQGRLVSFDLPFLERLYAEANRQNVYAKFREGLLRAFPEDRFPEELADAIENSVSLFAFLDFDDGAETAVSIENHILKPLLEEKEQELAEVKAEAERNDSELFREFGRERNISELILEKAKPEIFKYIVQTPGTFRMGSPAEEKNRYANEVQHNVTLTRSFEIALTPVTQLQWYEVMGYNPSRSNERRHADYDGEFVTINDTPVLISHPVETVSWNEVQEFIRRLNARSRDYVYRLPSEAEWEYAARAGTSTAYFFGNDTNLLPEYAWFAKNSRYGTRAVAMKKPSPSGLYDVYGNVGEMTQDYWVERGLPSTAQIDPTGPATGSYYAVRGGGWNLHADGCRSAFRSSFTPPGLGTRTIGFRLVRTKK